MKRAAVLQSPAAGLIMGADDPGLISLLSSLSQLQLKRDLLAALLD